MGLDGYTGPTSGRITFGGGKETVRESWTPKTDPPLTRDEQKATEWFRKLPPNEQIRAVRALEWNLTEARKEAKSWKEGAQRAQVENDQLRAKLATFTPEGFVVPPAAQELLDHAEDYGWKTAKSWTVDAEDPDAAVLRLAVQGVGWTFDHLRWTCRKYVGGRMTGRGLVRSPGRDWHDAPSLKKIKVIITEGRQGV